MGRPRIYLDGYNLALEQGTGVATYARNLSVQLGRLGAEVGVLYGTRASPSKDPLIREIAFFDARVGRASWLARQLRDARRIALAGLGEDAVEVPITGKVVTEAYASRLPHFDHLWNVQDLFILGTTHFKLTRRRLNVRMPRPPQLMHWTYPLPVQVAGARNIYTLHDLVPLRLPFTTQDIKRRYFNLCRALVADADHIVTVSEASKADIVNLLGADPAKVTNTYQSVALPQKFVAKPEAEARDEVQGAFGLPWHGYFLFFGAIEPKKNVGRLIEAYLASRSPLPLVLCGKQAWQSDEELRLLFEETERWAPQGQAPSPILARRLRDRIILLDYVPFRLLVSLVRGARAALFPSLYEGFGLPPLEAMALGTPVLTSNTASLPEVVGDAAITIDPYDVQALAEGIRALDADAGLRARLSAAGPGQAARFSPERYATRLAELYRRLGVALPGG
jgi:glycosyltransferase involved in cell wall biosynthesis